LGYLFVNKIVNLTLKFRVSTNLIKQISRFPGDSRRDFKKNPGHVCLASASFGVQLSPAEQESAGAS